jgi:hypothetical protein
VSREYETGPVVDSASHKGKKNYNEWRWKRE